MVTKQLDGTWATVRVLESDVPSLAIGIANYGRRTRRNIVVETTPMLPTPIRSENIPDRITEEATP